MAYRWATNADARRFLGWIPAALAGGAMEWRPHVILSGEGSIGKSFLMGKVVGRILGSLCVRTADGSEAAVARVTNMASLPVLIDEAEGSTQMVTGLLKLLPDCRRRRRGPDARRRDLDRGERSGSALRRPALGYNGPRSWQGRQFTDLHPAPRAGRASLAQGQARHPGCHDGCPGHPVQDHPVDRRPGPDRQPDHRPTRGGGKGHLARRAHRRGAHPPAGGSGTRLRPQTRSSCRTPPRRTSPIRRTPCWNCSPFGSAIPRRRTLLSLRRSSLTRRIATASPTSTAPSTSPTGAS